MMRKSFLYAAVALSSVLALSCSKTILDDGRPETAKYVEVGLDLGGEFVEVSHSPLVKASPTNPADSTLYVVAVYCVDSTSTTKGTSVMHENYLYAHGLFDDISKAHLKLLAGKRYSIRVKAIVNGINAIYHFNDLYDGKNESWMYSHQGHLTNGFFYVGVDNVVDLSKSENYKDMGEATVYYSYGYDESPALDIYYGGCDDILVSNCGSILPIDMYFSHYKATFIAEGLKPTDEVVACKWRFSHNYHSAGDYQFSLSYSEPVYVIERCFYDLERMYRDITSGEESTATAYLIAKYSTIIDGQEYITTFVDGENYKIRRKTSTTFSFKIDHDKILSNSKDFNLTYEDNDMSDPGGSYEFAGTIKE